MFCILTLTIVSAGGQGIQKCPGKCDYSPCGCCEENLINYCDKCESSGCDTCIGDKTMFKRHNQYHCENCTDIFGSACLFCQNFHGCGQCESGYTRVQDAISGLQYCENETNPARVLNCNVTGDGGEHWPTDGDPTCDFVPSTAPTNPTQYPTIIPTKYPSSPPYTTTKHSADSYNSTDEDTNNISATIPFTDTNTDYMYITTPHEISTSVYHYNKTESPSNAVHVSSKSPFANTTEIKRRASQGSASGDWTTIQWIGIGAGLFVFIACLSIIILIALRTKKIKHVNQESTPQSVHAPTAVEENANACNADELEKEIEGLEKVQTDDDIEINCKVEINNNEKVKTTKRKRRRKKRTTKRRSKEKDDDSVQLSDSDDDVEAMFENEGCGDNTINSTIIRDHETLNTNGSDTTPHEVANNENSKFDMIDAMQNVKQAM